MKAFLRREDDPAIEFSGKIYYVVTHVKAVQVDASAVLDLIVETARLDGYQCAQRWEVEGGSAGPILEDKLKEMLVGHDAFGVKPIGDKLTRALPFSRAAKGAIEGRGSIYLLDDGTGGSRTDPAAWNEPYLRWLENFDGKPADPRKGKVNDVIDASSGCYLEVAQIAGSSWVGMA
jgi:phage terminase large subunit-like protein